MEIKGNFEQTEIAKIPKGWHVKKIEDLFRVETGTTPSTKQNVYWNGGNINWFTPADMSKLNNRLYVEKSERKITEKGLKETNLTLMPNGSIIISTRAPVGYVVIVKGKATFNQGCKGLLPRNAEQINPEFYAYYLLNKKSSLQNLSGGSTFKELTKKTLENLTVFLPSLPEQKKIAEILMAVDDAIQTADEAIGKTKRLKKGLIQELLTKGIGHTEFKDTEIGKIPKRWQVVSLGDISSDSFGGGTPSTKKPKYWNGDVAWMTSAHINGREVTTGQRYITQEGLQNSASSLVPENNLLIATRVGIGKAAVNKIDIAISQDLTGIIFDKNKSIPEFIFWFIINNPGKLKSLAQGSTIKGLLRDRLLKLKLPLPPLPEQEKISEILSTVDKKMGFLRDKKKRLERIKQGLMNDLLTGRRRVWSMKDGA